MCEPVLRPDAVQLMPLAVVLQADTVPPLTVRLAVEVFMPLEGAASLKLALTVVEVLVMLPVGEIPLTTGATESATEKPPLAEAVLPLLSAAEMI